MALSRCECDFPFERIAPFARCRGDPHVPWLGPMKARAARSGRPAIDASPSDRARGGHEISVQNGGYVRWICPVDDKGGGNNPSADLRSPRALRQQDRLTYGAKRRHSRAGYFRHPSLVRASHSRYINIFSLLLVTVGGVSIDTSGFSVKRLLRPWLRSRLVSLLVISLRPVKSTAFLGSNDDLPAIASPSTSIFSSVLEKQPPPRCLVSHTGSSRSSPVACGSVCATPWTISPGHGIPHADRA